MSARRQLDICSECKVLAEADHRIANHLAMLAGYVRLKAVELAQQPVDPTRRSVALLLEGIGAQIHAVSRLHRSLALDRRRSSTNLAEHLHAVCEPLSSALVGRIEITEAFQPDCTVRLDQVLPLTQIATEVITNAIKHAGQDGTVTKVLARCTQDAKAGLVLEIEDQGRGLPEGLDPMTEGGIGFELLRALSHQLGASVAFESSEAGLRFRLSLPPAAP